MTARATIALRIAFVPMLLAGCPSRPSDPARTAPAPNTTSGPAVDPHANIAVAPPASAAGLAWDDPAGWQRVPPSSAMRRAQYRVPRAAGDAADAELVVITFGPGQGGDVESNLQRWFGQVQQADGRATSEVATRRTFAVGGFNVTLVDAAGRLGGGGMAMPGAPPSTSFEHGRLLAAIVETPEGPWFFKITGPDATVAAARPAFETMLRSVHAAR